jgi:quercetin dioxygenase-like cupin family protein
MSSIAVNHGFRLPPGEGMILPRIGRLKVSSAKTGGVFELIELDPLGGPPPHKHHDREECFYIIEGLFTFILGTAEVEAPAGSVVFVPRGTRHGFRHSNGARALVFIAPAGLEGFFHELGEGLESGRSSVAVHRAPASKYDSDPVG